MKKIALFSTVLFSVFGASAFAEEIKGEAVCAKVDLNQNDPYHEVIKVTKDGKTEMIVCEPNAVAKVFHKTVCRGPVNVVAKGTITEKDGKKTIALTKIEEAK